VPRHFKIPTPVEAPLVNERHRLAKRFDDGRNEETAAASPGSQPSGLGDDEGTLPDDVEDRPRGADGVGVASRHG
jgi:hypothetical protein